MAIFKLNMANESALPADPGYLSGLRSGTERTFVVFLALYSLGTPFGSEVVVFSEKIEFCTEKIGFFAGKITIYTPKITSHAQKITSHARKITSHAQKIASHAQKITSHARKITSHAQKITSHARKITSRARKITSHAPKIAFSRADSLSCSSPNTAANEINNHRHCRSHRSREDGAGARVDRHRCRSSA